MKRNLIWASPRRCQWLFLTHRAPCACDRVHGAAARSRPPDRPERTVGRTRCWGLGAPRSRGGTIDHRPLVPQHRGGDPELCCDLHERLAAAVQKCYSLSLELRRELSSHLRHRTPFPPPQELSKGV